MTFAALARLVAERETKGMGARAFELNIAEISETLRHALDVLADLTLREVGEMLAKRRKTR